jgi:hypothetical protein
MVLRIGYGRPGGPTPRRSVAEVLTGDHQPAVPAARDAATATTHGRLA